MAKKHSPLRTAEVGELRHPIEDLVDIGDHIRTVNLETCPGFGAEGGVEHRPVLGGVDVLSVEHGLDTVTKPNGIGKGHESLDHLSIDQVLRQVDDQFTRFKRESFCAPGIVLEGGTQVVVGPLFGKSLQPLPLRRGGACPLGPVR
jgi:hypothetical protein